MIFDFELGSVYITTTGTTSTTATATDPFVMKTCEIVIFV